MQKEGSRTFRGSHQKFVSPMTTGIMSDLFTTVSPMPKTARYTIGAQQIFAEWVKNQPPTSIPLSLQSLISICYKRQPTTRKEKQATWNQSSSEIKPFNFSVFRSVSTLILSVIRVTRANTENVLCSKHYTKCFSYIFLTEPFQKLSEIGTDIIPIFRWGNWGTKRLDKKLSSDLSSSKWWSWHHILVD